MHKIIIRLSLSIFCFIFILESFVWQEQLSADWNEDLDGMESFVLEGKKFVRLPDEELGTNSIFTQIIVTLTCFYVEPTQHCHFTVGEVTNLVTN